MSIALSKDQESSARETPISARNTISGAYRFGTLDEARAGVIEDLGDWIPEVPLSFFFGNTFPQNNIDPLDLKRQLRSAGILGDDGRWTEFPKDPVNCALNENAVFKPLPRIIQSIIDCAKKAGAGGVDFDFVNNPNSSPSTRRTNSGCPGGYFKLKDGGEKGDDWIGIFGPAEYKKGDSQDDTDDNTSKIVWSLQHMMRNDPRRRFALGFTIENTSMRIWFCSRSAVLVTKSFNFITDDLDLIRFVILLASADESTLGWNPTIRRSFREEKDVYDVAVHDNVESDDGTIKTVEKWYRTSEIISNYGADALRGRGTRVFKARRLEAGDEVGEPIVLKDVWIDHDRVREGQILANLKKSASLEDKAEFERYFLTVLAHGDVYMDGKVDDTLGMWGGQAIPLDSRFMMPPLTKRQSEISTRQNQSGQSVDLPPRLYFSVGHRPRRETCQFPCKVHYRIVFKEVCKPLHTIKSLFDYIGIMIDAMKALKLMHKYNYVHRDVSDGNIFSFNNTGKLSDLEYAKDRADQTSREVRIGTPDFMAVEVDHQERMFEPPDAIGNPAPFRYNALHDLESWWWISVGTVFWNRDKEEVPLLYSQARDEQRDLALRLFPGTPRGPYRRDAMLIPKCFPEHIKCLSPSFSQFSLSLNASRLNLVRRYMQKEARTTVDEEDTMDRETSSDSAHNGLVQLFEEARPSSRGIVLSVLKPVKVPEVHTALGKRKASTVTDGDAGKKRLRADDNFFGPSTSQL